MDDEQMKEMYESTLRTEVLVSTLPCVVNPLHIQQITKNTMRSKSNSKLIWWIMGILAAAITGGGLLANLVI